MKRLLPLLLAVFLSLASISIRAYVGDADTIVSPDASVTVFAGVDHFGVPRI